MESNQLSSEDLEKLVKFFSILIEIDEKTN